VPHSANPKPSWYGESVGHYEGDTLVVDTIGLNDKTFIDNYRTPHTEKLTSLGAWTKKIGSMMNIMKPGTPAGRQLDRAVKPIPPESTFSFSRFMTSLAHGFRLGLLRSATRNVGWPPALLGT
jgi:hypothetical protein